MMYIARAACPVPPAERDYGIGNNPYDLCLCDAAKSARAQANPNGNPARAAKYEVGEALEDTLNAAAGGARFREIEAWGSSKAKPGEPCVVAVGGTPVWLGCIAPSRLSPPSRCSGSVRLSPTASARPRTRMPRRSTR